MIKSTAGEARELSKIALQVATEASRLVLGGFRQAQTVSLKAAREPVTEYDLRSEELVRERLQRLTPEIPVVGEEGGGEASSDLTWYCDPIDGTVNFMRGHPFFAVSLGVCRGKEPLAGAVVAPALRLWWRGSRDDRAYRTESPCQVSRIDDLADAVLTTGLPVRGKEIAESGVSLLTRLSPKLREVRRCGSAAIELCMVADGTYDAYLTRALSPWDTSAGAAILLTAGGHWQSLTSGGQSYEFGCNAALHAALSAELGLSPSES